MPDPAPDSAQRARAAFWIDDAVIDTYAPLLRRARGGPAALAVYTALARRAGPDGGCWPSLRTLAAQTAASERTVQRALQALEQLGLVAVTTCYEAGSRRQTSNHYTLLPPPAVPPALDPDPARWPTPVRRTCLLPAGPRAQAVADARPGAAADPAPEDPEPDPDPAPADPENPESENPENPGPDGAAPPRPGGAPPVSGGRGGPVLVAPRPRHGVTPSPVTRAPQEGLPREGLPGKDGARRSGATGQTFPLTELGLSGGQVWAAALAELARDGTVSAADLAAWLRPAALAGRDGATLLLAAPGRVAAARLTERLLPAVRAALATVLGAPVAVRVIVAEAEAAPPGRGAGPPAAGPQARAARPARATRPARRGVARPTAVRPGGGRDRRTVAGRGGRSMPGAAASGGRDPAAGAGAGAAGAWRRQAGDSGGRPAGGR